LNNHGQVVGWADGSDLIGNIPSAFVYENGKMYNLNTLLANPPANLSLGYAVAINDLGQIIAVSNYSSNGSRSFYLLTPTNLPAPPQQIPEPSSFVVFALLFLAIGPASIGIRGRKGSFRQLGPRVERPLPPPRVANREP